MSVKTYPQLLAWLILILLVSRLLPTQEGLSLETPADPMDTFVVPEDSAPAQDDLPEQVAVTQPGESAQTARQELVGMEKSSLKVVKLERGPAPPYWVFVHRRALERGPVGQRWQPSFYLQAR